jgi:hypothetical protein
VKRGFGNCINDDLAVYDTVMWPKRSVKNLANERRGLTMDGKTSWWWVFALVAFVGYSIVDGQVFQSGTDHKAISPEATVTQSFHR